LAQAICSSTQRPDTLTARIAHVAMTSALVFVLTLLMSCVDALRIENVKEIASNFESEMSNIASFFDLQAQEATRQTLTGWDKDGNYYGNWFDFLYDLVHARQEQRRAQKSRRRGATRNEDIVSSTAITTTTPLSASITITTTLGAEDTTTTIPAAEDTTTTTTPTTITTSTETITTTTTTPTAEDTTTTIPTAEDTTTTSIPATTTTASTETITTTTTTSNYTHTTTCTGPEWAVTNDELYDIYTKNSNGARHYLSMCQFHNGCSSSWKRNGWCEKWMVRKGTDEQYVISNLMGTNAAAGIFPTIINSGGKVGINLRVDGNNQCDGDYFFMDNEYITTDARNTNDWAARFVLKKCSNDAYRIASTNSNGDTYNLKLCGDDQAPGEWCEKFFVEQIP